MPKCLRTRLKKQVLGAILQQPTAKSLNDNGADQTTRLESSFAYSVVGSDEDGNIRVGTLEGSFETFASTLDCGSTYADSATCRNPPKPRLDHLNRRYGEICVRRLTKNHFEDAYKIAGPRFSMSSMLEFRDLLLAAISHRVLASPKIFESYTDDPQSGDYLHVKTNISLPPQRGPAQIKETGVLAVPMPDERKRRELDLAELMAQAVEDILSEKTIGWEAAAKLVRAIKHAYPECWDFEEAKT